MADARHEPAPLARERLAALTTDQWAELVVVVREVLVGRAGLDEPLASLAVLPTGRLMGGRGRRQVLDALAGDPILAGEVVARLPPPVRERLVPTGGTSGEGARTGPTPEPPRAGADLERAKQRARDLRAERDEWRRRADGAQARAQRAEEAQAAAEAAVARAEQRLAALQAAVEDAAQERERALERQQRRHDARVRELEAQLAELRRAEEQRRIRRQRQEEQQRRPTRAAPEQPSAPLPRVRPGRPTRLPDGVVAGTTEAARLLLGPGRLVLVDGYNVTRQHRDDLDLEGQRAWLIQLMVTAVATHRWRPVVVFDGQRSGGSRPPAGRQQVEVRFTGPDFTADDELVLAVEATDEPVVVVTDDRELTERVGRSDADVVGTLAFLGVLRR